MHKLKKITENEIIDKITKLFDTKYKTKFVSPPKQQRLTEYEKALGFTENTRIGSKQFSNHFGYFMEDIYNLSPKFSKFQNCDISGCDGQNMNEYFECKNRHDTMKQSQAYNEIGQKLEYAIKENMEFRLLILVDNKSLNRDIPLHTGHGLQKLKSISGYDEKKHRWISGDKIYAYLFEEYDWKKIKTHIIELLNSIK